MTAIAIEVPEEVKVASDGIVAFAEQEVMPRHTQFANLFEDPTRLYDKDGRFSKELIAVITEVRMASAQAGFFSMCVPEALGGAGLGHLAYYAAWEALFHRCGPKNWLMLYALAHWAFGPSKLLEQISDRAKTEYLPDLISGKKSMCFGLSEPDAGSDVAAMRSRAVYEEATDEWVLNGTKTWITNGGIADVHVVVAVVDPDLGSRGHASFVIPPNSPGISQGQKFLKHGIRASHTAEVVLADCRIPGSCVLGGKDKLDERLARVREGKSGNAQAAMQTFESTRPAVGAQAVGIARAAYEYALEYAKERHQFGRPIIQNQSIAFTLADMAMEIEAARALVWRGAWLGKQRKYKNAEGSMAKLKAGRVAVWATERAIQILGGYGYVREYPVERWHRDAKIYDIFEGTEQIQQLVISRAISGMRIE